jgi:Fe2+ transport system protein FeoA
MINLLQLVKANQKEKEMTLDMLAYGSSAIITNVGGENSLRCRFLDMGIIPKTKVELVSRAPMGDPIVIRIRGYELSMRIADAQRIDIEEVASK